MSNEVHLKIKIFAQITYELGSLQNNITQDLINQKRTLFQSIPLDISLNLKELILVASLVQGL